MTAAYSPDFYADQLRDSLTSARVIVPALLSLFPAESVVDVGCGIGAWLKAFAEVGVTDLTGLDGATVPRTLLQIPADRFRVVDLAQLTDLGRRFDLACSLEVAEHLPERAARDFVGALVGAAPVVLFSAAIPGQGGVGHVNEQWQSYWHALFAERGYVAVDCIRPRVFGDSRVAWWYRQNALVYCEPARVPLHHTPISARYALDRIDVQLLQAMPARALPSSGSEALSSIRHGVGVLARALQRRMRLPTRHQSRPTKGLLRASRALG